MSYLSLPRLAFSGKFQADVSTVNNDVRHYDNATFKPQYQEPQQGSVLNGWWNPSGTGAFRLVDVKVTQALLEPGMGGGDMAEGLYLNSQIDRSAAKLVDLDPQYQMTSTIFGMRVALTDGKTEYMRGTFRPTPFRDIYFGRSPAAGSAGASAKFTSVLNDVRWNSAADQSPALSKLKASVEANGGKLAVNLMTYGFSTTAPYLGEVTGSIGAWHEGEPESFVAGRRFAAVGNTGSSTPEGIGYFDAEVSTAVSMDLSNALPLANNAGGLKNIGPLMPVVLNIPDAEHDLLNGSGSVSAGIAQGAIVGADDFIPLGEINYLSPDWLPRTGGIVDFPIPHEAADRIADHPLALVTPVSGQSGRFEVLIREAIAGLMVRADDFVVRMDAASGGWVTVDRRIYAVQYGKPLENAPLGIGMARKRSGGGGGGRTDQPTAPIPDINFPPDSLRWRAPSTTGAGGVAPITLFASDPGNPRGYIDGQIFEIIYGFNIDGVSPMPMVDLLLVHVRDAFDVPARPDWSRDIEPFMKQYGNLYPVMSHNLFSLSDPQVAEQHAHLLSFAFERPLDDPNHMPATRDLSEGKRKTVVAWLSQFMPGHGVAPEAPALVAAAGEIPDPPPEGALQPMSDAAIDQALAALGDGTDGKTQAMREFLAAQRSQGAAQ